MDNEMTLSFLAKGENEMLARLAAAAIAGVNGFFIALLAIILYAASLKPMNVPYLWPLMPFFPKAFMRVIIRFPMTDDALRPYIVRAKKRKRS